MKKDTLLKVVYQHAHTPIHTRTHVQVHAHPHTHTRTYTYKHTCTHTLTCTHTPCFEFLQEACNADRNSQQQQQQQQQQITQLHLLTAGQETSSAGNFLATQSSLSVGEEKDVSAATAGTSLGGVVDAVATDESGIHAGLPLICCLACACLN